MHTNQTCYTQSGQESESQAAELSQATAAWFCCYISYFAPILWKVNRHPQQNAWSHIFQQLTLTRFFSPPLRVSSFCETHRWGIYSRSLDFPLKPPSWSEIITMIKQLPAEVVGFFYNLPQMNDARVSVFLPPLLFTHHFCLGFFPPVNRGFSKDFGKRGPSAMPSTPGGGSKVVPIASLNPYQSKWVWLQFIPEEAQFCFYSSAEQDFLWEQVDLLSAGVATIIANDRVLLKRAQAAHSWCP